MNNADVLNATATELLSWLDAGECTSVEITQAYLDRIAEHDERIGAFLRVNDDAALEQAAAIDARRKKGDSLGPLAGVPVAVKDLLCTRGEPTTCASKILSEFRPPYDATVIEKLRNADAVLSGKTNLDEFAMGSSTENSAFSPTRNPHDRSRTPGGSSGGSAAAVAAGLAPLALGSDTGGSIRQPAAFCGVVGFKPTYGMVSRYGLVAFASSLDQIGPFARSVDDAALLLSAIAGHDPRDATSDPRPVPGLDDAGGLGGVRIGLPAEFFGDGLDPEVRAAVERARGVLEELGAKTFEVSLPLTPHGIAVYYLVAPCEASSNLARYDGVRYGMRGDGDRDVTALFESTRGEGFGREVKRRILLGTFALSSGYYEAYYGRAQKVRAAMRAELDRCFERADLLLTPTTPTPAFKLGEKVSDPLAMYLNDVLTVTANLCGNPALSVPCGRTKGDLPIGLQLMAPRFGETVLFRAARAYEAAAGAGPLWPPEPSP